MSKPTHRWTRIASAKWEDAWEERLRFLGPGRVAFISWPDSRSMKIEAYTNEATVNRLVKEFGGRASRISPAVWSGDDQAPRGPLSIRGKLKIYSDEGQWLEWGDREPRGLFIPAGMAFGTGEHATTASCLRILCDIRARLGEDFAVADLGTGSGILALAAKSLGAGEVFALDNDPAAVRVAKANAKKNKFRGVEIALGSVLEWKPTVRYGLIMANLFSELLMEALLRIVRAMKPGAFLIFSGVLKRQLPEVIQCLEDRGFVIERSVTRGKWSAGLARLEKKVQTRKRG